MRRPQLQQAVLPIQTGMMEHGPTGMLGRPAGIPGAALTGGSQNMLLLPRGIWKRKTFSQIFW